MNNMTTTQKIIFAEKLAHYASRRPKRFLQLDAFYMPFGDDQLLMPDEDRDAVCASGTVELMNGPTTRVLIPRHTHPDIAVRELRKLAKWLESNPALIKYAEEREQTDAEREHSNEIPF